MVSWTRRHFMKAAMTLPSAAWFLHNKALAAPFTGNAKITAVKVLQLDNVGDGCLIH